MALFTEAEARAFKLGGTTPLSSTTNYTTADITSAATRIKARFEDICGKAFESTSVTHTFDGCSTSEVVVPNIRVASVSAASNDGTALTAGQLAELKVYPHGLIVWDGGTWTKGYRNCSITYSHGHTSVPDEIKRAALVVCISELAHQGQSHRDLHETSMVDEAGRLSRYTVPTGAFGKWYGIPIVDSVLMQHFEKRPGIA